MASSSNQRVNGQITDAVTQANVGVVAEAPAQALGVLYQMSAHASGLAMQNATSNQNNMAQLYTSIVAKAIQTINSSK